MLERIKCDFDKGKRSLFKLIPGTHVVLQDPKTKRWTIYGIVLEQRKNGRSYLIEVDGQRFLRNQKMIRPCPNQERQVVDENNIKEPDEILKTIP